MKLMPYLFIRFQILPLKEKQRKRGLLKMRYCCGVSPRQLGKSRFVITY